VLATYDTTLHAGPYQEFRYDVTENLRLQLNVNNLLDEKAPRGVPQIFGGTAIRGHVETYAAGIFGRTIGLTARLSFQ
jgi:outer membrane receptor protein involved in Fe transport